MISFLTHWIDFILSSFALLAFTCGPSLLAQPQVMPLSNLRMTNGEWSFTPSDSASILTIAQGLVDEICHTDSQSLEDLLNYYNAKKGESVILNPENSAHLLEVTKNMNCVARPGGSGANTLRVFSALGGDGHASVVLSYDDLGKVYSDDLEGNVSQLLFFFSEEEGSTNSLKSIVDKNGDRTMFVLPGVMNAFHKLDLNFGPMLQNESNVILFLDAYTWAYGKFNATHYTTIDDIIHEFTTSKSGRVAFSLGTSSLVEAKREEILTLMPHLDFLFGNRDEMQALFQTEDIEVIKAELKASIPVGVVTLGKHGAWIVTQEEELFVPAGDTKPLDTTGAGDAFAGGFLYGLEHNKTLVESGQIAACVANEIIQHVGGRPQTDLKAACLTVPHTKDEL